MNLQETMQAIGLSTSDGKATNQTRLQLDVAKRIFRVSELQKTPYQNIGPEDWAKRWLVSDTFTLAEIAPHQVAVPLVNRINQNRVQATLMASQDEIEPIVIDLNKQHIGRTESGYVPKVIVVDGKHRHRAQLMQGRDRILAWVGDKAMKELEQRERQVKRFVIAAATTEVVPQWSKLDGIAQIYAKSMESMGGPSGSSLGTGSGPPTLKSYGTSEGVQKEWETRRGFSGDSKDRTGELKDLGHARDFLHEYNKKTGMSSGDSFRKMERMSDGTLLKTAQTAKSKADANGWNLDTEKYLRDRGLKGQGARSSGQLEEPDPSDEKAKPDPSDSKQSVDPSDRLQWKSDDPQLYAPGSKFEPPIYRSPSSNSPGSGVGPRITAGPIKVKKIVTSPKGRK